MPVRRTLLIFVVISSLQVCAAWAQSPQERIEQTKKEVLAVNEKVGLAIRTGDTKALSQILSDTFDYTNQTGELLDKAQMLANIRSGKLSTISQDYGDYHFRIYGDTVVLTGISRTSLVYGGKPSKGPRRFTRIYINQNGRWLLVAQHVTLVVPE